MEWDGQGTEEAEGLEKLEEGKGGVDLKILLVEEAQHGTHVGCEVEEGERIRSCD